MKMKKIVAILCAVAIMFTFAACGGKFKCDTCGQEKTGAKHTQELFGQKITMCDTCFNSASAAMNGAMNMFS